MIIFFINLYLALIQKYLGYKNIYKIKILLIELLFNKIIE